MRVTLAVWLEVLPKQKACPVQIAFHCFAGTPEALGDLVNRQLLDVAEQHDLAVVFGKRLEGSGQVNAEFERRSLKEAALVLKALERDVASQKTPGKPEALPAHDGKQPT